MFDCCKVTNDMIGMEKALEMMKLLIKKNKSVKVVYHFRQALYYVYQNKPVDFINNYINGIDGINSDTKEHFRKRLHELFY